MRSWIHPGNRMMERIRAMAMIGMVDVIGLLPVMWATGTGADVMKRLATPQVGGVCSAMLLSLPVIPATYVIWRWKIEVARRVTEIPQDLRGVS